MEYIADIIFYFNLFFAMIFLFFCHDIFILMILTII